MAAGLCKDTFAVSKEFHNTNRKRVDTLKEHGGAVEIDWKGVDKNGNITIREHKTAKGGYDYIDIPRALIDWHSHPGSCKSKSVCALGVPSPDDMRNIFIGGFSGSLGHLVYTKEGTYTVQVEPSHLTTHRESYIKNESEFKKAADAVKEAFTAVYDKYYNDRSISYNDYRNLWVAESKHRGFKVRLFQGDRLPYIKAAYDCKYKTLNPSAQMIDPLIE